MSFFSICPKNVALAGWQEQEARGQFEGFEATTLLKHETRSTGELQVCIFAINRGIYIKRSDAIQAPPRQAYHRGASLGEIVAPSNSHSHDDFVAGFRCETHVPPPCGPTRGEHMLR